MKIFLAFLVSVAVSVTGALYLFQPEAFDQLPVNALKKLTLTTSTKPALVVGFSAGKSQKEDIDFLIESVVENKFEAAFYKGFAGGLLAELDSRKRAGAVAFFDPSNSEPQVLVFVPVKEIESFTDMLTENAGFKIDADGKTGTRDWSDEEQIYFETRENYFYFSNHKETFARIIDNPAVWMRDIPSNYNVGLVYDAEQVPETVKQLQRYQLRKGMVDAASAADPATVRLDRKSNQEFQDDVIQMFDEIKVLKFGVDIAPKNRQVELFFQADGTKSSKLASLGTRGEQLPQSRFKRFRDEKSLANFNMNAPLTEDDVKKFAGVLDKMTKQSDARHERVIKEVRNLLKEATQEQSFDGSLSVRSQGPASGDVAVVFHANNTDRAKRLIKELGKPKRIEESAFGPLVKRPKPDSRVVTIQGLKFYQQLIKSSAQQHQTPSIIFAVGENEVYFGSGIRPLALMKSCLEAPAVPEWDLQADILFKINLKDDLMMSTIAPGVLTRGRSQVRGDIAFLKTGVVSRVLVDATVFNTIYEVFRGLGSY